MREILFRAKRDKAYCETQDWTYGVPFIDHEGDCIFKTNASERVVDPETVGQYTGLTDKNGKRIFEGDIVVTEKFNTPNKHYVITYDLLLAAFIGEDDGTMYFTTFDGDSEFFEVVGNIHDNPELLKGGE